VKAEGFEITTGADELEGDAPIWTYMRTPNPYALCSERHAK
jgi:hypothetical protein